MEAVCRLDTRIGQAFAEVAVAAIEHVGPVDLIVSHGQTLYHWVEDGTVKGTLQLGQPAWIAERTHVAVVSDLRPRDVAAGGQGAPLVSLLDTLLLAGREGRPAALNLGGIANLTVPPLAFDTGPGNALLDRAARQLADQPYDAEGALAASGTVVPEVLDRLLADPYYARPAPKSTGPEHFELGDVTRYKVEDVLATLTELTARTVLDAARAHGATELIVSGGGVHNATLMSRLARRPPDDHERRARPAGAGQGGLRVRAARVPHRSRPAGHALARDRRHPRERPGLAHARDRDRPGAPAPDDHVSALAIVLGLAIGMIVGAVGGGERSSRCRCSSTCSASRSAPRPPRAWSWSASPPRSAPGRSRATAASAGGSRSRSPCPPRSARCWARSPATRSADAR